MLPASRPNSKPDSQSPRDPGTGLDVVPAKATWQKKTQRIVARLQTPLASLLASLGVNSLLVLLLAGWAVKETLLDKNVLWVQLQSASQDLESAPVLPEDLLLDLSLKAEEPVGTPLQMDIVETENSLPEPTNTILPQLGAATTETPLPQDKGTIAKSPVAPAEPTELPTGGGVEGRWSEARTRLLTARGGTPASETAVSRALVWLAQHQQEDGSWKFEHQTPQCDRHCDHPGSYVSSTAATSLALLPFLGNASWEGEHAPVLRKGLAYLQKRMTVSRRGGDFQEGSMYAQGLATMALAEAYAMTQERSYAEAAEQGLQFIANSQHHQGGWRYFPQQPGDTTVLGWQMMALKAGHRAHLGTSEHAFEKGLSFLDLVQSDDGAAYGYQGPGDEPSPTAIGLLCRMYGGWPKLDPRLQRGIERIADQGYSRSDMYYNYYATQVMSHYGGPRWEAWNEPLRNHLIQSQVLEGHGKGSWYFGGKHTLPGGRLCETALATLILEVYYRHTPLYQQPESTAANY